MKTLRTVIENEDGSVYETDFVTLTEANFEKLTQSLNGWGPANWAAVTLRGEIEAEIKTQLQ